MLPSSTKLTILQRCVAQKCVIFCTYIISITVIAFILDWFDKKIFLKIVHEVNKQGAISEQSVNAFTILIESRDGIFFLNLIFIGIIFRSCRLAYHSTIRKAPMVKTSCSLQCY